MIFKISNRGDARVVVRMQNILSHKFSKSYFSENIRTNYSYLFESVSLNKHSFLKQFSSYFGSPLRPKESYKARMP